MYIVLILMKHAFPILRAILVYVFQSRSIFFYTLPPPLVKKKVFPMSSSSRVNKTRKFSQSHLFIPKSLNPTFFFFSPDDAE